MAVHSIREQILQTLVARLTPVAAAQGATVWRSPTVAITREQCPALVVFPESESLSDRANDRVTRELTVRVVALARAVPPQVAETMADALLCAAHTVLMLDVNLGGLTLGLKETESEWDIEDADAVACSVSTHYQITYRTLLADLSIQG